MPRWFNIAGACYADEHFMVPPEGRAAAALPLIEQGRCFSLVAGRQTGKTTTLEHLFQTLNAEGRFRVLVVDLQTARGQADIAQAMKVMLRRLQTRMESEAPTLVQPQRKHRALVAGPRRGAGGLSERGRRRQR